jgi:hypothetical protein
MTLESIYYIGQTVAVIAILGSLIGVIVQMRQANRLARAQLTSSSQDLIADHTRYVVENNAFSKIYHQAMFTSKRLTDVECTRYISWVEKGLMNLERVYNLHRNHLVEPDIVRRLEATMVWQLQISPLSRAGWEANKALRFSPEFIAYFDNCFAWAPPLSAKHGAKPAGETGE